MNSSEIKSSDEILEELFSSFVRKQETEIYNKRKICSEELIKKTGVDNLLNNSKNAETEDVLIGGINVTDENLASKNLYSKKTKYECISAPADSSSENLETNLKSIKKHKRHCSKCETYKSKHKRHLRTIFSARERHKSQSKSKAKKKKNRSEFSPISIKNESTIHDFKTVSANCLDELENKDSPSLNNNSIASLSDDYVTKANISNCLIEDINCDNENRKMNVSFHQDIVQNKATSLDFLPSYKCNYVPKSNSEVEDFSHLVSTTLVSNCAKQNSKKSLLLLDSCSLPKNDTKNTLVYEVSQPVITEALKKSTAQFQVHDAEEKHVNNEAFHYKSSSDVHASKCVKTEKKKHQTKLMNEELSMNYASRKIDSCNGIYPETNIADSVKKSNFAINSSKKCITHHKTNVGQEREKIINTDFSNSATDKKYSFNNKASQTEHYNKNASFLSDKIILNNNSQNLYSEEMKNCIQNIAVSEDVQGIESVLKECLFHPDIETILQNMNFLKSCISEIECCKLYSVEVVAEILKEILWNVYLNMKKKCLDMKDFHKLFNNTENNVFIDKLINSIRQCADRLFKNVQNNFLQMKEKLDSDPSSLQITINAINDKKSNTIPDCNNTADNSLTLNEFHETFHYLKDSKSATEKFNKSCAVSVSSDGTICVPSCSELSYSSTVIDHKIGDDKNILKLSVATNTTAKSHFIPNFENNRHINIDINIYEKEIDNKTNGASNKEFSKYETDINSYSIEDKKETSVSEVKNCASVINKSLPSQLNTGVNIQIHNLKSCFELPSCNKTLEIDEKGLSHTVTSDEDKSNQSCSKNSNKFFNQQSTSSKTEFFVDSALSKTITKCVETSQEIYPNLEYPCPETNNSCEIPILSNSNAHTSDHNESKCNILSSRRENSKRKSDKHYSQNNALEPILLNEDIQEKTKHKSQNLDKKRESSKINYGKTNCSKTNSKSMRRHSRSNSCDDYTGCRKNSPSSSQNVSRSSYKKSRSRSPRKHHARASRSREHRSSRSHRSNSRREERSPSIYRRNRASRRYRIHDMVKRKREESDDERIDKAKLLEIAKKNAIYIMQYGRLPNSQQKGKLYAGKVGGNSIQELTEFCKRLAETGESSDNKSEDIIVASEEKVPVVENVEHSDEMPDVIIVKNTAQIEVTSPQGNGGKFKQISMSHIENKKKPKDSEWIPVSEKKDDKQYTIRTERYDSYSRRWKSDRNKKIETKKMTIKAFNLKQSKSTNKK